MAKKRTAILFLLVLAMCHLVSSYNDEERESPSSSSEEEEQEGRFLLQKTEQVVKTEAGQMTIVQSSGKKINDKPLHVAFITMEPKSLFVPQYLDANLVIFVRRVKISNTGEVTVGSIYQDDLVEKRLKNGDVYTVEAGSAFYLVNTGEGQRLQLVCGIDASQSSDWGSFQSFFIGGGSYPKSVLSAFESLTMSTAFNVSVSELEDFLSRQQSGPIVYLTDSHPPSLWKNVFQLKERERLQHLKKMLSSQEETVGGVEEATWSIRKILNSFFGKEANRKDKETKSPDSYNLYEANPGYKNNYGWSTAIDSSDYSPLKHFDVGVYLVNLTAGSMLAPHINPTATEYGIVLRGAGTIQVVFPNGTLAMNSEVNEGDVFWVPRYFPFCQVASRTGPFEFFGFTTSAQYNRPQFLVGSNSVLKTLRGAELAASFGVSEEKLRSILDAQQEGVILPSATASPPDEIGKEGGEKVVEIRGARIRSLVGEMVMGFE